MRSIRSRTFFILFILVFAAFRAALSLSAGEFAVRAQKVPAAADEPLRLRAGKAARWQEGGLILLSLERG